MVSIPMSTILVDSRAPHITATIVVATWLLGHLAQAGIVINCIAGLATIIACTWSALASRAKKRAYDTLPWRT